MLKRTVWFVFLMMLALSCLEEPDCFSLNNNVVGIAFKKLSDSKADTVFFSSIIAEGTDSIFVENSLVTGINLPLNYYKDETVFHFSGLGREFDLRLNYSAKTQLVSEDCGERFVLTSLSVADHNFDSLRLLSATPKRSDATGSQIEIYRCPNTTQVKLKFTSEVTVASMSADYDAAFLVSSEPFETINIPMNVNAPTSTINFEFSDGTTRTITFGYSNTQRTLFSVCGEQTILHDYEVMSSTFTSTNVLYDSIQDPPRINFEVTL